jgi:hypothetical protein
LHAQHQQTTRIQTDSQKSSANHSKRKVKTTATSKKPAVSTPTTSTTTIKAVVATVTPKPSTLVTTPIGVRTSTKVEPVVTPSPGSSVNSLTPTTPTAPSSGGGSGSGSGSSGSGSSQTTTSYTSTNWSGYLATGGYYTAVSGSWQATNPTGNGMTTSADGTWIGIGGVSSNDLIQVGTQNIVSASGQVSTAAFYEMLPASSTTITSLTITPGDQMTASINEVSSGQWTISITDNTTNQTYSINVTYSSSNSSVEWIEEDPSYSSRHLIPFDNFQTAEFNNTATISNSDSLNLNSSDAQPVTMVNQSNQPIATPSAINSAGTGFSVSQDD